MASRLPGQPLDSRVCRGEWVRRGEFVVGSGDSRCGRFVPAGAGEDELGFAIWGRGYRQLSVSLWGSLARCIPNMLKSLQGRDSSSVGFLPNSPGTIWHFSLSLCLMAPTIPTRCLCLLFLWDWGHHIQAPSTSLFSISLFLYIFTCLFGTGKLPSFQKSVHLTRWSLSVSYIDLFHQSRSLLLI